MTGEYQTTIGPGAHWSLRIRRGMQMKLTDIDGGVNAALLFYNPENLLERYNAPDTLKCQHMFRLTTGNCLYSDMGRIFCSIIEDTAGWHETVCGNANAATVAEQFGKRDYQKDRNDWHQNGYDAFLVELAKYGLGREDMASNLNLFSKVSVDGEGNLVYDPQSSSAGDHVTLRFEMDTLVVLHTCPHPMHPAGEYPRFQLGVELGPAAPVSEDDACLNHCAENRRGFENNRLYTMGMGEF